MGTIWVRELTGGLDTRRTPETSNGGTMVKASDGHITRGGDFEQRAAFIPEFTLPAGTTGLQHSPTGLFVFGSIEEPADMPLGVRYQRLQHPTPGVALVRVRSSELYQGRIYAVGEFADGGVYHFYDGELVTDWYDGRARTNFTVISGTETPATVAAGSFEVVGGAPLEEPADHITSIKIDGVELLSSPVDFTVSNAETAASIAVRINSTTTTPNYTATASGQTVTIRTTVSGTSANGKAIITTVAGNFAVANDTNMAGGSNATRSRLTNIKVDNVSIISSPVDWTGDATTMAVDIADAINFYNSSPNYSASVIGSDTITIAAATPGADANGRVVTFIEEDGMVVSPMSAVLANGADSATAYQAGTFVKTVGQKMYSLAGPVLHFSGIREPMKWTTDTVGAGFIDMSQENSGSELLTSMAKYQTFLAVFAERTVQIWYVDPDPDLNRQTQVMNNTGTSSPRSVTPFGDTDIFYLDESGLRSLRARDSSNAAATTDIGVPVDTLIAEKLAKLTAVQRDRITGLIEPTNGRFWLTMDDQIFVFSFFNGAKVSAWSMYNATYEDENGEHVSFSIEDAVVHDRRVYLRSGNTLFAYGGNGSVTQYDTTQAEAWMPYLDAGDPSRKKQFTGVDAALRGEWNVAAAMQLTDQTVEDSIGNLTDTTFGLDGTIPFAHQATHISLRFRSRGKGPHSLSSCVIHFDGSDDGD